MFSSHYRQQLQMKLSLVYLLANIVITEGQTQDQYIGCFYEKSSQLVQWTNTLTEDSMTIERCIKHCLSVGSKTYARLQNGTVCECGDDYGVQLSDSLCNLTCAGNQSEYCGGRATNALQTIYAVYTVCPIGNYGTACDLVCHCKRQTPCDRSTGKCPDECDRNYNGSACNTATRTNYIGCFKDRVDVRSMSFRVHESEWTKLTLAVCFGWCRNIFSTFAGAQAGAECYCGESYGKYGPLNESVCNSGCAAAKQTEICGGQDAISVYSLCPAGNYGNSCSRRCNCVNDGMCSYINGSCLSTLCKPGWTGTSCNIRDCGTDNGDCFANETCISVDLKFTNFNVCRCSDGFQRNKIWQNCTDIDECATMPSVCGEGAVNCTNTIGGYRCHCKSEQSTKNEPCALDVDECSKTPSICGAESVNCSNTYGSYICYCKNGDTIRNGTCITMASEAKTATIIGAVVGSICGLLVILAIIAAVVCYRRRKSGATPSSKTTNHADSFSTERPISPSDVSTNDVYSVPMKIIPKKFTIKELAEIMQDKDGASRRYQQEFSSVAVDCKAPCVAGKRKEVKKKNRFKNIIPYDHCRVTLPTTDNSPGSDYINASFIQGYYDSDKLIATQGPRAETIEDFWKMIWEYKVGTIVMVAQLFENQKAKCEKYWPDSGQSRAHGSFKVTSNKEDIYSEFVIRDFHVSKGSETVEVKQWQLLSWEDCKTPLDVKCFLTFRRKIRQSISPENHTVVHCSAGVGRTGTFIAVDYLIEEGKSEGTVCILGCLQKLRQQRSQMVQTQKQYEFIYAALLTEFTLGDTTIQSTAFASAYKALRQKSSDNGKSKLELQFNMLEETRHQISEYGPQLRLTSKSLRNNKLAQMDAILVQGWKKPGCYISVKQPSLNAVHDFWTICIENGCRTVVFIDDKKKKDVSFLPTKEKPVSISSTTLLLQSASEEDYGMIYKISQQVEATYENRAIYENWKGIGEQFDITVLHMTEFLQTHSIEIDGLLALYNVLQTQSTAGPVLIVSSSDYELTGFCLAAFNGFDMLTEVKEIDVYQIVQDIRKSKSSFIASSSAYEELHKVFSKFIDVAEQGQAQTDE